MQGGPQILGLAFCRYILELQPLAGMKRAYVIEWITPTVQLRPKPA